VNVNLKIETKEIQGVAVVSCHGRIQFGEESSALRQKLKDVLVSNRKVVLDLSGVSYIDSGGLGMLVGVYSSARAAGADIKLAGLGQRVRDVLAVTKLVTVFETFENEAQAVASFGGA
jgi:anti-sigma B factor antagonist